jgi:retron-type reverse transcriptase
VVEADIKGFFDHLDHEWLLRMLNLRIGDGVVKRLIRKWLKAGILMEDGSVERPEEGTPQGGLC